MEEIPVGEAGFVGQLRGVRRPVQMTMEPVGGRGLGKAYRETRVHA